MSLDWLPLSHSPKRRIDVWPFYYERSQLTMSRRMREVWGEDCTIQIYGGCVRIHSEQAYLQFFNRQELEAASRSAIRQQGRE
ncbi:hypothetical protein R70211_05364 [Paraburkholderia domus]|uniref:Uncharacterized protein n=1 Tax=Paraburkholderia domus TaxID=2793075 RepID=A0A9N8R501_9BURK|nr:hypothetical protein R70211_05364 [Paraburkholderia domus]